MRRKILWLFTACIYLGVLAFGIVKRQTYTDLSSQENYLSQIQVGELPESTGEQVCAAMCQELPDSAIILRVKVTGDIEHLYHVDRQRAVVQEVYAGDGPDQGDEVYIFSNHWCLILDGNPDALQRGFVNIMKVGSEYLVFAEDIVEDWQGGIPSVKVYDDFVIAPVFCYEDRQNVIIPISSGATYVPYEAVKDNEFFVTSEKTLQSISALKEQMLVLYPRADK